MLDKVIESKKMLIISTKGASLSMSTDALKGINIEDGESVEISIVGVEAEANLPRISNSQQMRSSLFDINVVVLGNEKEKKVTNFTTPIQITLDIDGVNETKKVAAFHLDEVKNVWEYVGGKVNGQTFTFTVNHLSKYAVLENDKTFDDIHTSWATEYIEVLASKNIIQGKTETLFGPNEDITRAQFAALLSRALHLPKQQYVGVFSDVSSGNWAAQDIEAASRVGIVGGENGKFRPNEKITRQQMATMIIRAIEYKNPAILNDVSQTLTFKDANSISDYAKEYVGISASLGIISGREEKGAFYFAPKENATRAHAAKMLYQFMELE